MPTGRTQHPLIDLAHNWWPRTVRHPQTLSLFGDESAWEYIADALRAGMLITYRAPNKPENGDAYELIEPPHGGSKGIYMKVALVPGVGKLVGLSFHYERH